MKLDAKTTSPTEFSGGLLAVARRQDGTPSAAEKAIDTALDGALSRAIERLRFDGKAQSTVALDTGGRLPADRVLLVGLGKNPTPTALRDYAAIAVSAALSDRFSTVGLTLPADADGSEIACGAVLGGYRFNDLKAEPKDGPRAKVEAVTLLGDVDPATVTAAQARADAVNAARTMVNEPPNVCTPERLADFALGLGGMPGVEVTVLGADKIRALGMGGLVGVSQGATRPPRFIHIAYVPEGADPSKAIALVGKGITFDSGGLSLKPPKSQIDMYIDMAGSAAVLGAMQGIVELQPNVAVHGIVAACENMPGGNSYRPSDILTMYSGKTVEILNTDAEGRLVLADALHYATMLKPRGIVNLATLTGACMVALGPYYGGLFSDNDEFADQVLAASTAADENLWRLPLDPKLAKQLESKRADITNLGGPWGGAITAAQFLQHFKGDVPWVHLDIAGAALAEKPDGYIRTGGTGFAVLTLIKLIEDAAA